MPCIYSRDPEDQLILRRQKTKSFFLFGHVLSFSRALEQFDGQDACLET